MMNKNETAYQKRINMLVGRRKEIAAELGKIANEVESYENALPSGLLNRENRRKVKKLESKVGKLHARFELLEIELEEIKEELDRIMESGDVECKE